MTKTAPVPVVATRPSGPDASPVPLPPSGAPDSPAQAALAKARRGGGRHFAQEVRAPSGPPAPRSNPSDPTVILPPARADEGALPLGATFATIPAPPVMAGGAPAPLPAPGAPVPAPPAPARPSALETLAFQAGPDAEVPRVSTRTWATVAVVALLLALVTGGAAAALWRQNAALDRQVTDVQAQLGDVAGTVDGLAADAESTGGATNELGARLAALEEATQRLAELEALAERLSAVEATAQDLKNRAATAPTAPASGELESLRGGLDAVRAEIAGIQAQIGTMQSQIQSLCVAVGRRGYSC